MPARLHDDGIRRTYTGRGKAYRIINHVLECEERHYMMGTAPVKLLDTGDEVVLLLGEWKTTDFDWTRRLRMGDR